MNILILSAHKIQLDRRIIAEANTLVAAGGRVTLVSVPTRIPTGLLDERVRVICTPVSAALGHGSRLRAMLLQFPDILETSMRYIRDWTTLNGPGSLEAYFRARTPKEQYGVIHCHDLVTLQPAVALRQAMSPKAKLIYDSHELFPYQFTSHLIQRFWSRVERQYIGEADLVITVNQSLAEKLAALYNIRKPEVLYNGFVGDAAKVRLTQEDFCRHFGTTKKGFVVLFHGDLFRDRNLRNLVRAFGLLDDSVKLHIMGTGTEEQILKKICFDGGIKNVFFGPWVPQERLMGYLRFADLGVIPYLGDRLLNNLYCTPNKLFEFIEAGVPICASDLPELRRILVDNRVGAVYSMNNPREIARGLTDCVARARAGEFGYQAFEAAREKFGWSSQATRLLALYETLQAQERHPGQTKDATA